MEEQVKVAVLTQNFNGMVKGPGSSPNDAMKGIEQCEDEKLFAGLGEDEKLSAYRAEEDIAIVQSAGLFTPCVQDAEVFGAICAAHALNDIYAVNADPKVGLNLVGFPNCQKPVVLGDILAGGAYKVKEAGAVLVGGHTIQDDELKYGLCVTGFVDPKKMWTKDKAEEGDVLILTKAVGTGYIACAAMADMAGDAELQTAGESMSFLNKYAVDLIRECNLHVHACCEVSGFGLTGAISEISEESRVSLKICPDKVPVIKGAEEYAGYGLVPALLYENKKRAEAETDFSGYPGDADWMHCPEISGGLLFAMPRSDADIFLKEFREKGYPVQASEIGEIISGKRLSDNEKKIYWTR